MKFAPGRWTLISLCLCWLLAGHAIGADNRVGFDHDQTAFPLDYVHARVACDVCHVQRVFAGTPTRCHECHQRGGRIKASAPSPTHISTTNDCEFCHQSGSWENVFRVDHFAVTGSCESCHNGITATGKSPGHIQSGNHCDDCHRTFSWEDAVFDHGGIAASCVSCHNGISATGKPPLHILTNDTCEDCHHTISWVPVLRVDHDAVFGTCSSCHNGVTAEGKPPEHIPTTEECDVCHSTLNWTEVTNRPAASEADVADPSRFRVGHCVVCVTAPATGRGQSAASLPRID